MGFGDFLADVFDDGPGVEQLEGELAATVPADTQSAAMDDVLNAAIDAATNAPDTAPSGGGFWDDALNGMNDSPDYTTTATTDTQSTDMDDVVGAAVDAVNNADDTAPSGGGFWDDALNGMNDAPAEAASAPEYVPAGEDSFVAPPPSDMGFDTAPSPEPDYSSYDDGSGSDSPIELDL